MTRCILLPTLAITFAAVTATAETGTVDVTPTLPHAHAHNDYYHDRPLLDALDHGFCSVEADIFPVDGKLLVGHDRRELRPHRTLQSLYLDPLLERVRRNDGWVHEQGQPLTLLVDIKADGEATYRELREALKPYREMLSYLKDGAVHQGAVELVLSGDRPHALVASQTERYVFIDGRLKELTEQSDSRLVPLVSENWNSLFKWRGGEPMPADQRQKLRRIVQQMHQQNRRLRFWATPEKPEFWQVLTDEGVDLIGTDELGKLRDFWARQSETPKR